MLLLLGSWLVLRRYTVGPLHHITKPSAWIHEPHLFLLPQLFLSRLTEHRLQPQRGTELEFFSLIKKEGNTQYTVLTASRSRSMIVSSSSKWRSFISSFFIWVSTSRATRLLIFRSSTWAKCFEKKKKRILGSIKQSEQKYQKSNFELQRGFEGLSSVINLSPEKLRLFWFN